MGREATASTRPITPPITRPITRPTGNRAGAYGPDVRRPPTMCRIRPRWPAPAFLAVASTAGLLACAGGTPTGTPIPATPPTTIQAPTDVGTIDWGACPRGTDPTVRCGELILVDTRLPLALRPASGPPADRRGHLVVHPGGPGLSARAVVLAAEDNLPADVLDAFDVVAVDARATGGHDAAARCAPAALERWYLRTDPDPDDPDEGAARADATRALVAACRSPDRASSAQAVADLDILRQALGATTWSLLGFSYGSEVLGGYALAHPDRVRALVADGALPPGTPIPTARRIVAAGFEDALERFFAWCDLDPACGAATAGDAAGAFDGLAARLDRAPIAAADAAAPPVGPAVLAVATVQALYRPEFRPALAAALADALAGDGARLGRIADAYLADPDQVSAYLAVSCADAGPLGAPDAAADLVVAVDAINRESPRLGPLFAGEVTLCAAWGARTPPDWPEPAGGTAPALVVVTEGDPATPAGSSRAAARTLGARVLTYPGEGHGAIAASSCVREAAVTFLLDPATALPARCP
jgi:pimeloyl-ACP methyl ester carboxylesterase